MKKLFIIIIAIVLIILALCSFFLYFSTRVHERYQPSERTFYKKSDIGTDVYQLTTNTGEDHNYYQEPNYFSPDSSKFLFKSSRSGMDGIYLVDLVSGEITVLKKGLIGHSPTWSKDGSEIYYGQFGKINAINVKTFEERKLKIPNSNWTTFIHTNPSGDKLVFVEEGLDTHKKLSVIDTDGSNYQVLYTLDKKIEFYLDHPIFINDNDILFLTRGEDRNADGDFNKPYIMSLDGNLKRLPVSCSHYDVHPNSDKILCGTDGHIIDLEGNILKNFGLHGHGVWHPDGNRFLVTHDPLAAGEDMPYRGKITIHEFDTNNQYDLVSHESTYNSTIEFHIQPNAQFSRDGRYVIYESERGQKENSDLYLVELLD